MAHGLRFVGPPFVGLLGSSVFIAACLVIAWACEG